MENLRKHSDIKLLRTEKNEKLFFQQDFSENLFAIEKRKRQILMNKLAYLSLSILELSKTVMYEFWYYYVKPKYGEKAKLCFKDTGSFIVYKNK